MMHFVHISEEDLRKHPWLGIVIGIVAMTLFTFIAFVAARDYISFSKQISSQIIDVQKLEPDVSFERKWVTLINLKPDCTTVEKTARTDFFERLIEGSVYDTYIIIPNNYGKELIVAIFHGDQDCKNLQDKPLTGILTTTDDYSYGAGFLSTRLSKTTTAGFILRVGEGLAETKMTLAVGIFFDIFFLFFTIKSIRFLLIKSQT